MRRPPLLAVFAVLAVLAPATGCSSSGGNDEPAAEEVAVDEPSGAPGPTASAEELLALLPTADEVGSPYTSSSTEDGTGSDDDQGGDADEDGSDDPADQALDDACPAASELDFTDSDDNTDEVAATFATDDDREIEIRLDPTPTDFTEDRVREMVGALNDCGTISVDDDELGTFALDLTAEVDDTYGDFGVQLTMAATFEMFGTEVDIDFVGQGFVSDGVAVFISASSGFAQEGPTTMVAVPADVEVIPDLAELMEQRVSTLGD